MSYRVHVTELDEEGVEYDDYRQALVITHDGEEILRELDGGEPEDQTFNRNWSWVKGALLQAYTRGREDGRQVYAELKVA